MAELELTDNDLRIARGQKQGYISVNKYGRSTNVDSGVDTDIWDGANATDDIDIWVAPTQARTHTIVSSSANDSAGTGILTLTGNALDTETVTIGSKTYTFQTVLTDVDGNVLIGATASDSIDNLISAINLAAGAGTLYAASTTAGDDVVAEAGAGDTMNLYDQLSAALATTETLTNGSWGGATVTAGTGARTIQIYGLTSWTTKETSEVITMHGAGSVTTTNSYVIIHRIRVLTFGSAGPNDGKITATAATDATVTAMMLAGEGQTQMAIYGIPSTQKAYVKQYYISSIKAGLALSVENKLLIATSPDTEETVFVTKHTIGRRTDGTSAASHMFYPPNEITGPAIIKLQSNSTSNDADISAGFDIILIDN